MQTSSLYRGHLFSKPFVLGFESLLSPISHRGLQARPESLTSCACIVFGYTWQLGRHTTTVTPTYTLAQEAEVYCLFRKQVHRLFFKGHQYSVPGSALESSITLPDVQEASEPLYPTYQEYGCPCTWCASRGGRLQWGHISQWPCRPCCPQSQV